MGPLHNAEHLQEAEKASKDSTFHVLLFAAFRDLYVLIWLFVAVGDFSRPFYSESCRLMVFKLFMKRNCDLSLQSHLL